MKIEKLLKGHEQVIIEGECSTTERQKLSEEAIAYFQANPKPARKEHFGIKNYAGFGDQRCDCERGYGPTHGSIVFEIDYNRKNPSVDEDGINLILTAIANPEVRVSKLISNYLRSKGDMETAKQQIANLSEFDLNA